MAEKLICSSKNTFMNNKREKGEDVNTDWSLFQLLL